MANPFSAQGLSLTPMTRAQIDAIVNPFDGQMVQASEDEFGNALQSNRFEYYHSVSGTWHELNTGPGVVKPTLFEANFDSSGNPQPIFPVGEIKTAQALADFHQRPVAELIRSMFYPTFYPQRNSYSFSVTTTDALYEAGETIDATVEINYTHGTIQTSGFSNADGIPVNYSLPNPLWNENYGQADSYLWTSTPGFTFAGGDDTSSSVDLTSYNVKMPENDIVFAGEVTYLDGDMPYNSKGTNLDPEGNAYNINLGATISGNVTIKHSYHPLWTTAANTYTNMFGTLQQRGTDFPSSSTVQNVAIGWTENPSQGQRHSVKIPVGYHVSGNTLTVKIWDPNNGSYSITDSGWVLDTTVTEPNAQGLNIDYEVWKRNDGTIRSSSTIYRFIIS
jgi:hypothetical protein